MIPLFPPINIDRGGPLRRYTRWRSESPRAVKTDRNICQNQATLCDRPKTKSTDSDGAGVLTPHHAAGSLLVY